MALTMLNLNFWSQVAATWARTLTASDRTTIEQSVATDVALGMDDLIRHGTHQKIKSALDAILEAADEDDEEDW